MPQQSPRLPLSPGPYGSENATPVVSPSISQVSPRPGAGSFGFMRRARSSEQSSTTTSPVIDSTPRMFRVEEESATPPEMEFSQDIDIEEQERPILPRPSPAPRIPSQILPPMDISSLSGMSYAPPFTPASASSSPRSNYSPRLTSPNATSFQSRRPVHPMEMEKSTEALRALGPAPGAKTLDMILDNDTASEAPSKSIANRTRNSYHNAQIANINGPRRIRRRKEPSAFNILVVGTKGSGKTSFIEFLLTSLDKPSKSKNSPRPSDGSTTDTPKGTFVPHCAESEVDGERIAVTIYDSKGLERHVVDLQLREMATFVESKFQETFSEEQKVMRTTGVKDSHIHCVILLLDPGRLDANINAAKAKNHGGAAGSKLPIVECLVEDLDIDIFRTLQNKATVIPIISKADTVTAAHMTYLKRSVAECVKQLSDTGIDPYVGLVLNDDESEQHEGSVSSVDATDVSKAEAAEGDSTKTTTTKDGEVSKAATNTSTTNEAKATPSSPTQGSVASELPLLPLSVISPDTYDEGVIGRRFPWGFADPYNADHCDFVRFKDSLFFEWKDDLRVASRERWYEGWRTSRLRRTNTMAPIYPARHVTTSALRATSGNSALGPNNALGLKIPPVPEKVAQTEAGSGEVSAISESSAVPSAASAITEESPVSIPLSA